jgi:hypothetical protein
LTASAIGYATHSATAHTSITTLPVAVILKYAGAAIDFCQPHTAATNPGAAMSASEHVEVLRKMLDNPVFFANERAAFQAAIAALSAEPVVDELVEKGLQYFYGEGDDGDKRYVDAIRAYIRRLAQPQRQGEAAWFAVDTPGADFETSFVKNYQDALDIAETPDAITPLYTQQPASQGPLDHRHLFDLRYAADVLKRIKDSQTVPAEQVSAAYNGISYVIDRTASALPAGAAVARLVKATHALIDFPGGAYAPALEKEAMAAMSALYTQQQPASAAVEYAIELCVAFDDGTASERADLARRVIKLLAAAPASQGQTASDAGLEYFAVPARLHPNTVNLVARFAGALAVKLAAAERKYGHSDGWASPDWMEECRQKLAEHIAKGDPRDVAAYCAFLWHHGESTTGPNGGRND